MPSPMRMAVCPQWGYFTIDDIYTGAIKGQRRFVINTLVGDLILVQAGRLRRGGIQGFDLTETTGCSRVPNRQRSGPSSSSPARSRRSGSPRFPTGDDRLFKVIAYAR